jgi:hypothetical protein
MNPRILTGSQNLAAPISLRIRRVLLVWAACACPAILSPLATASGRPVAASAVLQPRIEVRGAIQDRGEVDQGTVLRCRFGVSNPGRADLEILGVKPGCGCTVARWDRLILPGKERWIEADVQTVNFRGPITKHLTVFTNDPDHPQVDLTITARVIPLIQISPGPAALLAVGEKPASQEFIMERSGRRSMKILQVTANAPYLKAEAAPLPGVGRWKLTVTATPDCPLGHSTIPVIVRTDVEKSGLLTLTVGIERGIVSVPPLIYWGMLPREMTTPAQGTITVLHRSGAFHVTGVTVDDPKLQAKLETVRQGRQYQITVTYAGGWEIGRARKTLTVATDDPQQPFLKIPVQALIYTRAPGTPAAPSAAHSGQLHPAWAAPLTAGGRKDSPRPDGRQPSFSPKR